MGIGGSGMSSIAKYLKQKGYHVEGYDQRISYITNILENDGVRTYQNYEDFIYEKDVLYIISSAVNLNNTFLKNFKKIKTLFQDQIFSENYHVKKTLLELLALMEKLRQQLWFLIYFNLIIKMYHLFMEE